MDSFLLVKPDYVRHAKYLVEIARRIVEFQGIELRVSDPIAIPRISRDFAARLYAPNSGAPHFPKVLDYWAGKPSYLIALEGYGKGNPFRETLRLAGSDTDPFGCRPDELRGAAKDLIPKEYQADPNQRKLRNIVHRSDSEANLQRELALIRELLGPRLG